MKQKLCCSLLTIFFTMTLNGQQVPNEISFNYVQVKSTIGTETIEDPAVKSCINIKKANSKVIGVNCTTNESQLVFIISGVQSEKKEGDTYIITFFGSHYYSLGPVNGFLTYGYSYSNRKWSLFMEDVFDNNQDGVSRALFKYFNIE